MFLRSSVVKKSGKTYRYWKLVENVRTDTGPRQQVVAHLGALSNFTAADWQALAGRMGEPEMAAALQRRVRQGGRQGRPPKWTVEDRSASAPDASDVVSIRLSETSWREPVAFGDVYAALVLWKRLGLVELLGARLNASAAKVPWPAVAALIAVNRLVEPMAEWPMVRWWQRTALPQLLGIPPAAINDDRLYRCLDLVLPHKQAIEERIAGVGQSLFGQSYRYLLYDLTSTYFEGQMESNPKAVRGYSRDHRPDCKQVTIGAVVDREGYPVGYEVLAGNVRDHNPLCAGRSPGRGRTISGAGTAWTLADQTCRPGHRRSNGGGAGGGCGRRGPLNPGTKPGMRAEGERHSRPHAVQTESSLAASREHGEQGAAGEAAEDRPAHRLDPGASSGDVELGVRAPRGTSRGHHGGDGVGEEEAGRETAPGGALARPARNRGVGAATGRRVPAAHQRGRNRCGAGVGGLCDAGTRGERVPHVEARSGIAPGLPSPGGTRRGPRVVLLDRLCDVLGAGADSSSTGWIAEWPPRVGGVAWRPNGDHLSAKGGWGEAGTGAGQHSQIGRSLSAAFAECRAAPTACSPGPSGSDPSGGDLIRPDQRL